MSEQTEQQAPVVSGVFQVLSGTSELGAVDAAGGIYDVTFDGKDNAEVRIVNGGADGNGKTVLATVGALEEVDGVQRRRIELTSVLEDRRVAVGDVLVVRGGKDGTATVTIQRDAVDA